MSTHPNLLGEPPATLLPPTPEATKMLSEGKPAVEVAAAFPTFSLAWALLAELALEGGRTVEAYAYARTGYHRGLDALRRNGWKGHGPIPRRSPRATRPAWPPGPNWPSRPWTVAS